MAIPILAHSLPTNRRTSKLVGWKSLLIYNFGSLATYLWVNRQSEVLLRGKVQEQDFPTSLGNAASTAGFPLLHRPCRDKPCFDLAVYKK